MGLNAPALIASQVAQKLKLLIIKKDTFDFGSPANFGVPFWMVPAMYAKVGEVGLYVMKRGIKHCRYSPLHTCRRGHGLAFGEDFVTSGFRQVLITRGTFMDPLVHHIWNQVNIKPEIREFH